MRQLVFGPLSLILLTMIVLLGAATSSAQSAPVVTSVSAPANGYYGNGDSLTFAVQFSESVIVSGTPYVSVIVGSQSRQASYLSGSGTSSLLFRYALQSGDMDMDGVTLGAAMSLNGGTIENAGGEATDTTLNNVASTAGVFVNTQSPTVVTAVVGNPPSNATQVTFQIAFSEAVTGMSVGDMVLTTTGTASATLANLQTSDNITYTVLAQNISGLGTLRLDIPANSVQNIAGNGNLAGTGAPWTAGASSNADLSQLQPSQGNLSPVFNANTLTYSISVANNVTAIALTPVVSEPNATVTVNGSPVTSGSASSSVSLAVGATTIPVVVTAQDATVKTYNVTVTRAASAGPTATSRTINVMAGTTVAVDLTAGATGAPFTAAALTALPSPEAGSVSLDAAQMRLTFSASPSFAGAAAVGYTLSNASGTSAPATITFAVAGRPDPTDDPDVVGLLDAQADAARHFAQYQTRNFNSRLEQLHDEGERRRRSLDIRLGLRRSDNGNGGVVNAERQYGWPGGSAPDLTGPSVSGRQGYGSTPEIEGPDIGPFAVWSGGFVDFADTGNSDLDIGSTTVGVSAGVDYRFSDRFVGGFGLGYGHDKSDVGDDGTESRGAAYSAAIYGSFKAAENLFLDGLIGASRLDFDSSRYVASSGDLASGERDGRQMFGSLTAAYEFRNRTWLVSPYGRFELSRSWLDGFTENGGGIYGLTYGDQTVDTAAGVIGLRLSYTMLMDWGALTPGVRAEYTHDFASSSRLRLGYSDIGTLPYELEAEELGDDYSSLGLSLDAALLNNWAVGVEYRAAVGSGRQDHAVGIRVRSEF
ncbi:outer membrane autotransporter protein [Rhizobium sp. BK316]|uniref:autotransporter domain-containing protein n=1 Tax=Rhizobium sp. BK316 TaxID=2587053 RepID=UPI00160F9A7B|nr:autotransporter domain-containing protein [Rhizobium sp. BK316]MBB3409977.1 outer membrane autotransporter protein [Rhizobium sp. BK316]